MDNRQRLLGIIQGHSPDRIPWIPRLEIWYRARRDQGDLPPEFSGMSLREVERALGAGTPARNGKVLRTELRSVDVKTQEGPDFLRRDYVTPRGTVTTVHRCTRQLAQAGIAGLEIEHMIKGPDDYPVVEFIIEHTEVLPAYDEFLAYDREIGGDGLPLVAIGQDPMNRILQEMIGYNQAFFHLADFPRHVERLYQVLCEQSTRIQEVVLDSPALLVMQGEHFDSRMTPPPLFRKYMLPYFRPFSERLRERGKVLVGHADADTSLLLELIAEAGFGMLECFVTHPMVPMTLAKARKTLNERVILWGGIPSIMLCDPVTDQEFLEHVRGVFRSVAPGDAFVLGVADNVMPEAHIDRIRVVSRMVDELGVYPIGL